jgi:hypothetical protein
MAADPISRLEVVRSPVHEHANPPQTFRLLRVHRERPCRRRAAKKGYEIATPHGGLS